MSALENIVKRKIKNRKFAIENLGLGDNQINSVVSNNINSIDSEEINKLFTVMFNHIQAINDNWYLNLNRPICSNRKVVGSFIVFAKKVLRKLIKTFLGWYIFPIIETQNTFNSNAVNSINLMKDVIVKLTENDNNNKILKEQYENNNEILKEQYENIIHVADSLNCEVEKLIDENQGLKKDNEILAKKLEYLTRKEEKLEYNNKYILDRLNVTCDIELLKKAPQIDYFKFENKFRGSRDNIKNSQRHYVDYFRTNGGCDILDIGCGRGEFLELMYDYGLSARGVDSYEPFIEYCKDRGFKSEVGDALTYLDSLEDCSLGGIFMGQVIEHLSIDYLLALIKMAYKKMIPGTYFIIETPNPETISTYKNFYLDSGHIKPVHFLTLEYCFQEANYESVKRFNNEFSKYPLEAKHIKGEGIDNSDEFNNGIDVINDLIFGYRDYTLIARK